MSYIFTYGTFPSLCVCSNLIKSNDRIYTGLHEKVSDTRLSVYMRKDSYCKPQSVIAVIRKYTTTFLRCDDAYVYQLGHHCLGNVISPVNSLALYINKFQRKFRDRWLKYLLWNIDVSRPYLWLVNIASGNGLVPSGIKPLPEPMLTQI